MTLIDTLKFPYRYIRYQMAGDIRRRYRWVMCKFFPQLGFPKLGLLVNERELLPQYKAAIKYLQEALGAENIGDYLEFGVCQGTSFSLMYSALLKAKLNHVRLFGFDSFEGLPYDEEGIWPQGFFAIDYNYVVESLSAKNIDWSRCSLIKGLYSDTLNSDLIQKHKLRKASLIMIDVDLYASAKEALNFCKPLILDKTIIFFDEWNFQGLADRGKGEKRAFDEFLQENREFTATEMGSYSYFPGDNYGKVFLVRRTE
ncbi:macrocin O-methyltransferase [Roseofilum sp. BLCC_M154]|uniref:Macrocin O-methyltransferase n=1 Tax=Roseofilum acuticapitatum BLCC-M154 TaxID=3022444 RepID=A0ABT7APG7_9CYAN|nr:TylF/MycF/NovP-related O-methyltransferase [Roseofilum acuticapitatum]MDJ1168791.1 macrocin O-methyltransferase [Roseofilum acuticapitatum BLCC-M154]